MKKPYYSLIPIVLLTSLVLFAYSYGPDNPLGENVYEYAGLGSYRISGAGVNNTVPQTTTLDLLMPPDATVEQAYLYSDFHCELYANCPVYPSDNATAILQGNNLGEIPPYSSDEAGLVYKEYWNIYRWDATEIVRNTGTGTYTVTIDSPNNPQAWIGNVFMVVVYNSPSEPYSQIILNDGIELLYFANNSQTTFHNVHSSATSGVLGVVVTGGDVGGAPNGGPDVIANNAVNSEFFMFNGVLLWGPDDVWFSQYGPNYDAYTPWVLPVPGDNTVIVGTGPDDIGWELAVLQAILRDVSADSQTHPHAQVVQGSVEPIDVVVKNNGDPLFPHGVAETFDVDLYVTLPPFPGSSVIGTQTVTNLAPGSSTTLTFNWDTSTWAPGTYSIYAWADSNNVILELDELNNYCDDPATIRVMAPPNADADGPYEDDEGSPIAFDASGSTDEDGSIALYEWDFDDDGVYDWSGPSPTIGYIYGDDYNGLARLRVTDDDGLTDTDTANALVHNVPPDVDPGPDQESLPGHQFTEFCFQGTFTDPGWLDTHTAEWDFGDGSPTVAGVVVEENNPPDSTGTVDGVCHQYWVPYQDDYTVTLTVYDDDGGYSITQLTVTILRVIGGEEMPLDAGAVLASVIYSYWWIPTLMAIALAVLYTKKRRG